jgi:sarcosine oxidase
MAIPEARWRQVKRLRHRFKGGAPEESRQSRNNEQSWHAPQSALSFGPKIKTTTREAAIQTMSDFDAVVIGLGVTGSAALYALARRGLRVVGIEQFVPGHDRGSSHGATRVIRLSYFEHPSYVPLLREAYEGWRALEAASGQRLLTITGILEAGLPDGELIRSTLQSAQLHALPHDIMPAKELMQRFPAFQVPADFVGVYQPDGGFLAAEPAVAALIRLAADAGAHVQSETHVSGIEPLGDGVRVTTASGIVDAKRAIVAAGPWLPRLLPALPVRLRVTRQVLGWFNPKDADAFRIGNFPVFLVESRHGVHYGFPVHDATGFKVAKHHHFDESVDPDAVDREISQRDENAIRNFLAEHLPAANGPLREAKTCLYTMAPDGDFIIDALPSALQIIVASPCSGHGFKFAPVTGEILADLATSGTTSRDISRFRIGRFG